MEESRCDYCPSAPAYIRSPYRTQPCQIFTCREDWYTALPQRADPTVLLLCPPLPITIIIETDPYEKSSEFATNSQVDNRKWMATH